MDCDVALQQFVTLCGQNGHVDKVLEVWNEWFNQQLETGRTRHFTVQVDAVMTALSTHPTTFDVECDFDGDVQTLGSMLKCAGNLNRFDVVERVWKWSQSMRKHRLDGGGGMDCDVALNYTMRKYNL